MKAFPTFTKNTYRLFTFSEHLGKEAVVKTKPLFQHTDYKAYLSQESDAQSRGFRKRLAEVALVQTAYVSNVLNGKAHFSWEQAEAISRWLGHTEAEKEFFLYLVEFTRAGTHELKSYLEKKLSRLKEKSERLETRVKMAAPVSAQTRATYYSAWYYAAVHMAVTIPALRTLEALENRFKLDRETLVHILNRLCEASLVLRKGHEYFPGKAQIHLPKESELAHAHHTNWRTQAIRSLDVQRLSDYHYSGVVTLTSHEAKQVRDLLSDAVERSLKIIQPAKEETLYAMTLDFFELSDARNDARNVVDKSI